MLYLKNSNTLTGGREGQQVFGSINFSKIINKTKFNFNPTGRIDLGYTELDKYNETGKNALTYDKHEIITRIASLGMIFDNTTQLKSMTLKRNGRLEYNVDFSPSSEAKLSYVADPETDYTLSVGNEATHNLRAGIGLDLSTQNGFSLMANYERNQGKENGHSDNAYFSIGYVPNKKIQYALSLNDIETMTTSFGVVQKINDFDLKFNIDYDFFGEIPDRVMGITLRKSI